MTIKLCLNCDEVIDPRLLKLRPFAVKCTACRELEEKDSFVPRKLFDNNISGSREDSNEIWGYGPSNDFLYFNKVRRN